MISKRGQELIGLVSRAAYKYRRDGAVQFLKSTVNFLRGSGNLGGYQGLRNDNELRWEIISEYLNSEDDSLIDIGCAEGYFTYHAADYGLDAIGIDISESRIAAAQGKYRSKLGDGLNFEAQEITQENIQSMPSVDVCLLLTVHHHFDYHEGERIFKEVAKKCNKIFYEPPGVTFLGRGEIEPEESVNIYSNYIESTLDGKVEIRHVSLVPRVAYDEREDPLFVLDVTEYP